MKFIRNNWLLLTLLAALLVRLPQLFQPMWNDEAFTWIVSGLDGTRVAEAIVGDVHPPLFYSVEWVFGHLSRAPWVLRLFPLCCGLACVVLAARVARAIGAPEGSQAAAALITAFAPNMIYYSAEARMYSLLAMLYLAGVLAVYRGKLNTLAVLFLALLATHHYGWFYCATLAGLAVILRKGELRSLLLAGGWALLAYAMLLLPVTVYQFQHTGSYWAKFSIGELVMTFAGWFAGGAWSLLILALLAGSLALTIGAVYRAVLRRHVALLWLTFAPVGMALVTAQFKNIWLARALIGSGAMACVLLAVEFRARWWALAVIGPVLALGVVCDQTRQIVSNRYHTAEVARIVTGPVECVGITGWLELQPYRLPYPVYLASEGDHLSTGGMSDTTLAAMGAQAGAGEFVFVSNLPKYAPEAPAGYRLLEAWSGVEPGFGSQLYIQEANYGNGR